MKIGFIGLGNMGGPMAANLAAAGHEVTGFDPNAHFPQGIEKAENSIVSARGQDVVITMLPNGDRMIPLSLFKKKLFYWRKHCVFFVCALSYW